MPKRIQVDPMKEGSKTGTRSTWHDAAGYTVGDLTMVRTELFVGFLVAGLADTLIPISWWHHLFLSGHGFLSTLENVILGPFIAFISFVCSVGNVPLGAALWNSGISFGETISFIFADLVALPLVLIYKKFFGLKLSLKLVAVFWFTMSLIALVASVAIVALYLSRDRSEASPYAKDPICGMQVEKATAAAIYEHDGEIFYFCSPGCMTSFESSLSV